ncbi:hypothetical protein [Psychrobacillus sp. FSL H8-0510]|uniref:hypothetical protein n=1 Tax=Psychrobacillus sp. FSL H8-0510 TaxID=2921394 RepID=UPI0030FAB423
MVRLVIVLVLLALVVTGCLIFAIKDMRRLGKQAGEFIEDAVTGNTEDEEDDELTKGEKK